ncbi:hypothetical protein [Actinotalea sp. K2]|uniref:hypothetical protein n=1 Tax=Actinotalea sp. K2 TaxID=2939438 RepID=UPI002017B6C5|nr:hypothetical protein [Actinotalea sp. K2]MCL3862056.1 hypothetical protein [Actinotalea sp. K2]
MSLVSLCSVTGSPGVTTTAMAMGTVWPVVTGRRVVVLDADASGSGVLPGYLRGAVPSAGGVLRLAATGARTAQTLLEHCVAWDEDHSRLLLVGVTTSVEARGLGGLWHTVTDLVPDLDQLGVDLVADVGRLEHVSEPTPLLERAGSAVVVTRPTLGGVLAASAGLERLRTLRGPVRATSAMLVGERRPYSADEVRHELGVDRLPVLSWDPRAAERLHSGEFLGRGPLLRTQLMRSASVVVEALRPAVLDLAGGPR